MMRKPCLLAFSVFAVLVLLMPAPRVQADPFAAEWQGRERTWVGPEYFAIRWQDWSVRDDRLSVESRPGRSCVVMTRQVDPGDGRLTLAAGVVADEGVSVPIGFWLGVRGPIEDQWRSAAAYGNYHAFAGIRPDGTLVLRDRTFETNATVETPVDPTKPFDLRLMVNVAGEQATLTLTAEQGGESFDATLELKAYEVVGLLGLGTADQLGSPIGKEQVPKWHFDTFAADGDRLALHDDRTFGPIGWTQYTHVDDTLKLTVLMMPVGANDAQEVDLLIDRDGEFEHVAREAIDPLARAATFRVEHLEVIKPRRYRVRYEWQGETFHYDGILRPAPTEAMTIAVMSCDWGYAFPNAPLVANVTERDPDLLVYAGDQIYEFFGKFGAEHEPLDRSTLDYLRKYALFGWINRDLLRDRPSIIIPDDHDVFQGNIWGAGGKQRPPRVGNTGGDPMGGYRQPVEWINAMQKTQTWHLPDGRDVEPIDRGISVYFSGFTWGNVHFAILEDRKWKTGYRTIWPTDDDIPAGDYDALDPPGTELLGPRQEAFLEAWAKGKPDLIHVAISQTMFAKAHTHTGPNLRPIAEDFDTNGWPRTPRNRAVKLLGNANALHLAGDQHVGILAQLGVVDWTDGPLAFMVPGTANGWPRAWWPNGPGGKTTGRFVDEFGNQMTILAVANPEPGSNDLRPWRDGPYNVAHSRGSGFGLVTLDLDDKSARFEMTRYLADDDDRAGTFPGFPQTFRLFDDGWERADD